jgi:hypothetical protein
MLAVMDLRKRASDAFFGRFLYGTSAWTAAAVLVVCLVFIAATISMYVVATAGRPVFVPLTVLSSLIAATLLGALLYYGARQATMMRRVDEETQRADDEKRIAGQLQEAFLQQQLPSLSNVGFSATYLPASTEAKVGGDWYDAFELPDGRIMFSIGDVAGHGVGAAVTMSRARQTILAAALQETNPGAVMARANLSLMLQDTRFATATCGYIDPRSLEVTYATAGHPPGIVVAADGTPRLLEYDGLPLGVAHDARYPSFSFQAEHDALLILYTDGLIEYDRDVIEGERRILEVASDVARRRVDNPAAAIRDAIFEKFEPSDDVAIMTISFADTEAVGGAPDDDAEPRAHRWSVGFRGVRAPFAMYGEPEP